MSPCHRIIWVRTRWSFCFLRRLCSGRLAVLNFHSIIVSNVDNDTIINLFDTETTPNTTIQAHLRHHAPPRQWWSTNLALATFYALGRQSIKLHSKLARKKNTLDIWKTFRRWTTRLFLFGQCGQICFDRRVIGNLRIPLHVTMSQF